jgi:hypothetical protein
MFDVCITGDTAHIDTIFNFLPHTRQHSWHYETHCIMVITAYDLITNAPQQTPVLLVY